MVYNNIRNYEVSIWTLQDSFLSVLKGSNVENKGQIQDPKMSIKDDGTLEFSFSLPMYLYEGPNRKENPIWYNAINGNLMVNLRKIKVIFNKNTEDEGIFEFLITVVTERHEDDELYCDVECEGLAFHELGKIGYKISLSQDDYITEWGDWANESYIDDTEHSLREPHNNINYWCDKVFKDTGWSYSIQMDWSAYDGIIIIKDANGDLVLSEAAASNEIIPYAQLTSQEKALINQMREERGLRRNDKIYEDEYVSSWTSNGGVLSPRTLERKREKYRLFDESESNIYNLTQTIAETFEVFCKYVYSYDENYHIVGREVVFYNNFLNEAQGELSITYPYATNHIEREMDGTEIVTKMYVKTLDDSSTESGLATIIDTAANRSGEDYILNFDYLYSIGTISQEQYDEIPKYEARLHSINNQIQPLESELIGLEEELTDLSASETIYKNSVSLDNERISANDDLLNSITDGTGIISVTNLRPDICYIIENTNKPGTYCINIRQKGIIRETIHIYRNHNTTSGELSNEITKYTCEVDNDDNLTGKIINMSKPSDSSAVYVIYDYKPQLYYENIKQSWINKRNQDITKLSDVRERLNTIDGEKDSNGNRIKDGLIQTIEKRIDSLLVEKEAIIKDFNKMMGAALREGNWQPEDDYANYGDKHTDYLTLNHSAAFNDELVSIGWDNEVFDDEQKNYYEEGVDQKKIYYPCIDLTDYMNRFTDAYLASKGDSELLTVDSLSFIFQDMPNLAIENPSFFRYFPVNSQCVFTFIRQKDTHGKIIPVLMITGIDALAADVDITSSDARARIGYLHTTVGAEGVDYTVKSIVDTNEIKWISNSQLSDYEIVYPRIRVNSANLKVSNDELSLFLNNSLMPNYEGYYILNRVDEEDEQYYSRYYITIKPDYIFKNGSLAGQYVLNYTISNTALIMYLDAIDVLKENAYPKVSYTIDPTLMNDSFTRTAYNSLSRIVHINDADLKFENIRGYISELDLDLDRPWEDSIEIKNYKTKFEDLFSNIVAQTEEMKKNSQAIGRAASLFTSSGVLKSEVIQATLERQNLDYAFNQGTLTIDEANGIWGTSDDGVVAYRGGGIFTATEKDEAGDWIWNTGILPSGINADLITTGQLDTNLIRIYAGNDLKFQMNGDGLFAYKSWLQDKPQAGSVADTIRAGEYVNNDLKPGEYVVHNSDGLFLVAKKDTPVLNEDATDYINLEEDVNRVAISWDGLTIRNWSNEPVFYADTKGDLVLSGTIYATDGEFSGDVHARSLTIGDEETPADEYIGGKVSEATDGLEDRIQEKTEGYVRASQSAFEAHFSGVIKEEIVPNAVEEATGGLTQKVNDELLKFGESMRGELDNIQEQIDGNITTWFYKGAPSIDNLPTSEWKKEGILDPILANEHLGDLYYDEETGYCYRWMQEGNGGSYIWKRITDTDITKALDDAHKAKDTADSKRRVFYTTPRPPYDEGDLWVQGKDGDIFYCQNAREKDDAEYAKAESEGGDTFNALLHKDWALASKYTDDSALLQFKKDYEVTINQLQTQVDGHIATHFGSINPADSWPTDTMREQHIGDLWFCQNSGDPNYKSGYLYRYDINTDPSIQSKYTWTEIDSAPSDTVLRLLKNTNRVYITSPQDYGAEYKVGDLWIVSHNDVSIGPFMNSKDIVEGDLLVCQNEFEGYDVNYEWTKHWTKAIKNIDVSAIEDVIQGFQEQLDSKIQTWYDKDDPSKDWRTDKNESNKHNGDLWYNTDDSNTYRWQYNENEADNGYYGSWEVITSEIPSDLYDKLDGKASVFVNKPGEPKTPPTPPYQVGDLWFKGSDEPILTCIKAKPAEEDANFSDDDWVELNKYTEELNDFVNNTFTVDMAALRKQIDGKLETFIQSSEPSNNWNPTQKLDHIGDMWKCTDEADTDRYNKYFSWNGTEWIEMDKEPPKAYFDSIDGKAQIFITTPKGPYHTGDLWFTNETDSADFPDADPEITGDEILTCVTENRTTGSFNRIDWQRRVKYTDDSIVKEVNEKLIKLESDFSVTQESLSTYFKRTETLEEQTSEFQAHLDATSDEISEWVGKVEKMPNDVYPEYCITDSNIIPPGDDIVWQLTMPERQSTSEYVWYRLTTERNGKPDPGAPICLTGNNGTGIIGRSTDYQRSRNGDTAPNGLWYGNVYQANEAHSPIDFPYLWTRTITTYDNLPPLYSYSVSGDGKSVSGSDIKYGISKDINIKPDEWKKDMAELNAGPGDFIWTRIIFIYKDGETDKTLDPVYSVSSFGEKGEPGEPGTSLTGHINSYIRSNEGINPPNDSEPWKSSIELADQDRDKISNPYLWSKLTMTYSDDREISTYTVTKDGTSGYNTIRLLLYKRSKDEPEDKPGLTHYNFETRELTGELNDWAQDPPPGDDPLYVISNSASSLSEEMDISSEWSDPVILVQNGTGYNTAPLFLYQRALNTEELIRPEQLTYEFEKASFKEDAASLNGWSKTVPEITEDQLPCFMIQAVASSLNLTADVSPELWSWPPVQFVEDGEKGFNSAVIYLYKRSKIEITEKPSDAEWLPSSEGDVGYNFRTKEFSNIPKEWSGKIPSDTLDPIYVMSAIASSQDDEDKIPKHEWSMPSLFAKSGINCTTVFLYKRTNADGAKIMPSITMNYSFITGKFTNEPDNGWSTTVPEIDVDRNSCYMIQATAMSSEDIDPIDADEWTEPIIYVQDGISAYNNAHLFLYTRSKEKPGNITVDMIYHVDTGTLDVPQDLIWNLSIPDTSTEPVWITTAVVATLKTEYTVEHDDWAEPVLFVQDGVSYSSAPLFLYQRSNNKPQQPTSVTYYFKDARYEGELGDWTTTIPERDTNGHPCYVTQAMAIAQDKESVEVTNWAEPVLYSEDGFNTATVTLYKRSATKIESPEIDSILDYDFTTGKIVSESEKMNGWSMSIPTLNSNYTIYVTSAIVASQGTRDQIDPSEWSEPVTLSGPNNAIIYLYQRAANTGNLTEIPEIVTYSFSEKKIISDTGNWSQTPPEMTEDHLPCYIIQATVLSSDITDTVNKGEWSNPVILAKDGIDGTKITKIVNYYQVNNSEKAPSIDSGIWISDDDPDNTLPQVSKDKQYLWNFEITYDEEEPLNTTTPILLSKWSEDGKSIKDILEYFNYNEIKTKAPDYEQYSSSGGVGPGWVEREKFSPPDPKNDKIYYVWNIEVILYNDNENSYNQLSPHISSIITKGKDGAPGSPGSPGSNGYSAETVMLYKRSSVENPDPPLSTITYYLKDYSSSIPAGTFSGNLNGWSTTIAAANNAGDTNNPLYMIAARASTQYYSDTIYSSEWTDPVVFTENGQNGYTYAAVKIYKCSSTPLEDGDQPNKETEFYYIFSTGSLFERTSNGLKGWYTTLHEALANGNNEPCYISETQLVTDSANNNEVITFSKQWSTPVLYTKNGIDGSTYYTWIRYAENVAFSNNVVTRVDGMTAIPNDKTVYIGFAYNKTTKDPDSNSKITDYTWSKFIGSDGVAGESGYTWIKYAKNVEYQTNEKVNVETMYDDPKDMSYIGLAFNQTKREESNDPNDYQWSLIKGARGGRTLAIVTEPKRFTSGTIKYRILTSTVLSESKSEDVIVGDVLQTSSYLYPVISIDSSYVNLAERKSARGARTFVITTTPAGATTWNGVDYPHFKSISAIQNESKIVDNVVIGDMLQLESILYPVLYVGEINAYLDNPITIKGDPGRTPVDIVPQFAFTKTIMDSAPTSDSEWYPDTSNYSSEKPIIWERVIYYYKYPNDYVIVGPYISSDLSELQTSVAELKIEQGKAQLYAESLNHYNLLKDSKFKTITIIGSTIINSLHLEVTGLYKSIITKYTGKMTISFTISCSKSISTSLYYHTPSGYGLIANNISTTISGQKYSIPIDITENDDKQNIDYFYFAHPQSLTENNTFTISDAMLNLGDNAQPWTSSTDDNVVRRSEIDVQDDGIKMFSKKLPIKTNGDIIVPSELNSENANGTTFIINDHLFKAEIITEGLSKEEGESGIVFSVKQNKDGVVDASGNQLNSNPTLRISDTTIEVNTLHAESIIANNLSTSNLNLLSVCDATDEELVKNKASSDISDLLNNKILNKELEINCFGAGLSLNGIYGSGSLIINLTAALIEPSITNCKIPIIIKPKTYYISKLQVSQSDQIYIEDWQLGKSTSIITAKNMSQIFCSLSNYTGTGLQCNSLKGSKIFINKSDGGTTTGTIKAACSELGTIAISKEIAYTGNLSGNENSGDVSGTLVENTVSVNMKGPYEAVGDKGKSLLSSGDPRVGKWNMSSNPGPSSLFSASIQIQSFPAGITSSNIVSAKLKVTRVAGVGSGTSDPFGIYVGSGSGWPITRGGLSYSSGAPSKDDAFAYFTLVNGNSKTIDVTSAIKYMLSYTSYKYLVIANYDTTKWGSGTSSYSRGYSKWKFTSLTITYKGT